MFPDEHDQRISVLLYTLAHWHALAKLRVHTDFTLDIFRNVTKQLGERLRDFEAKTCSCFEAHELERERQYRIRRDRKRGVSTTEKSTKKKTLNLSTPKLHMLGHYPDYISFMGTTLNYNSQSVRNFRRSHAPPLFTQLLQHEWLRV